MLQPLYQYPQEEVDKNDVGKSCQTPEWVLLQYSDCCGRCRI